jgi:hypothetical protein
MRYITLIVFLLAFCTLQTSKAQDNSALVSPKSLYVMRHFKMAGDTTPEYDTTHIFLLVSFRTQHPELLKEIKYTIKHTDNIPIVAFNGVFQKTDTSYENIINNSDHFELRNNIVRAWLKLRTRDFVSGEILDIDITPNRGYPAEKLTFLMSRIKKKHPVQTKPSEK